MKYLDKKNKMLYIMDKRSITRLDLKKTKNICAKESKKNDSSSSCW